jgi:uncharacterized protein YwbE
MLGSNGLDDHVAIVLEQRKKTRYVKLGNGIVYEVLT